MPKTVLFAGNRLYLCPRKPSNTALLLNQIFLTMNKTLILASAALLALTASCGKQEAQMPTSSAQAGQVIVSFVSEQNTEMPTRAFFDSSATTEV